MRRQIIMDTMRNAQVKQRRKISMRFKRRSGKRRHMKRGRTRCLSSPESQRLTSGEHLMFLQTLLTTVVVEIDRPLAHLGHSLRLFSSRLEYVPCGGLEQCANILRRVSTSRFC